MNGIASGISLDIDDALNSNSHIDDKRKSDDILPSDFAMILATLSDDNLNNYYFEKKLFLGDEILNSDNGITEDIEETIDIQANEIKQEKKRSSYISDEYNGVGVNLPFYFNSQALNQQIDIINHSVDIEDAGITNDIVNLNFNDEQYIANASREDYKSVVTDKEAKEMDSLNDGNANKSSLIPSSYAAQSNYSIDIQNSENKTSSENFFIQEKTEGRLTSDNHNNINYGTEDGDRASDDNNHDMVDLNNQSHDIWLGNINDIKKLSNKNYRRDADDILQGEVLDDNNIAIDEVFNQNSVNSAIDMNLHSAIFLDQNSINFEKNIILESNDTLNSFADLTKEQEHDVLNNSDYRVSFLSDDKFLVNFNGQNSQNTKFIIDFSENKQRIDITIFDNNILFNSAMNDKNMMKTLGFMGYDIGFANKTKSDARKYQNKVAFYSNHNKKEDMSIKLDCFI